MALRLKIVSDNAAAAGEHPRWTFGVNGGRIGRHETNDWVLRDTDRYVSGRHAEIEHRGGTWWVRDLSTNGTFINDSDDALGVQRLHQLENGDRIRIGEYDIEVEISGSNDFPANEAPPISVADLDASFEVRSVLSTGRRDRESLSRRRPEGARAAPPPAAAAAPAQVPPSAQLPSSRAREEQDLWPGLVALCKGAGIDPRALPPESRISALHQGGQLLRETLVGFTELASTRADFASEFGIASGARRRDATSPLVQISAVEPLLEMMLAGRGPGDARAVDEIRGQFARARHHEIAVSAALREALAAVFEKLDPDELESQLGRRAKGTATADRQLRLWNRYRELFRATVQTGDAGLPAVFLVAFARAYESITSGGSARSESPQD
ncbi:MAG: type VI secretion system-associated FHA domain protein [Steroidobacteraceae bacterium]